MKRSSTNSPQRPPVPNTRSYPRPAQLRPQTFHLKRPTSVPHTSPLTPHTSHFTLHLLTVGSDRSCSRQLSFCPPRHKVRTGLVLQVQLHRPDVTVLPSSHFDKLQSDLLHNRHDAECGRFSAGGSEQPQLYNTDSLQWNYPHRGKFSYSEPQCLL